MTDFLRQHTRSSATADKPRELGGDPGRISRTSLASENQRSPRAVVWRCLRDSVFSGFDTIPACDGRTDRQTDGHTTIAYIALAQHRAVKTLTYAGLTENGGHENDGPSKLQGMKLECKRIENAVFHYIF